MESALFYYNRRSLHRSITPDKPLGVLFLSSLRDIALEEQNGQFVQIDGKSQYIKGVIEKTLEETKKGGRLFGLVEVKGLIVDDTESDLNQKFDLVPTLDNNWIYPIDLLSKEKVWNIPSLFRKLKLDDIQGRKKAKYEFEYKVYSKAQSIGADIIILDSYMARIDYLQNSFGLSYRLLNIHPGPTLLYKPFCFRGSDPIKDAIIFAKQYGGPVYTGATLHFVNESLDGGKYIAYICNTPVNDEDDEIKLMQRNYYKAKLPIFIAGLRHYILRIYPYLKDS